MRPLELLAALHGWDYVLNVQLHLNVDSWRSPKRRRPREIIAPVVDEITAAFEDLNPGLELHVGGSWRRGAAVVGDLDLLVITDGLLWPTLLHPGVLLPSGVDWQRFGPRIANGDLPLPDGPLHIDVWQAPPTSRGPMLCFFTGPAALNVYQRRRAKAMGLAFSQNALADRDTKQPLPGTETERGCYAVLGMPYLTPEERQRWA